MIAVLSPGWSWFALIVVAIVVGALAWRYTFVWRGWAGRDDEFHPLDFSTLDAHAAADEVGDAMDMFRSPWHPAMVGHHDAIRAYLALSILAEPRCVKWWADEDCITMSLHGLVDVAPYAGMIWTSVYREHIRDPHNWCTGCIARQGLGPRRVDVDA